MYNYKLNHLLNNNFPLTKDIAGVNILKNTLKNENCLSKYDSY